MTVWVTRVAPYQNALIAKISALGHEALHRPLFAIEPKTVDAEDRSLIMDLDRFEHVVFISQTAIDFAIPLFDQYWPQWPERQVWWTMGERTALQLGREHPDVHFAKPSTTEGLLKQIDGQDVGGQRWLIVRGCGGRELLKESLESRGARVDYLELYRRKPQPISPDELNDAQTIFVSSTQNLLSLMDNCGDITMLEHLLFVLPSERTAAIAKANGLDRIAVADGADDDAMIKAWKQYEDPGE